MHCATEPDTGTAVQWGLAPSRKSTVPVTNGPPPLTVAVNTTVCPTTVGLRLLARAVDVVARGVTLLDAADGKLLPTLLVATTVQDTDAPLLRPATTIGDAVPLILWLPEVAV
jgi:hypothetical protein